MYKDVGKKILAVMLCICMLVGMAHVSNLRADASGELDVILSSQREGYTGTPYTPSVEVKEGETVLASGDYTLTVQNDLGETMAGDALTTGLTDAGNYTIKAEGQGAYAGKDGSAPFKIEARDLTTLKNNGTITVTALRIVAEDVIEKQGDHLVVNGQPIITLTDTGLSRELRGACLTAEEYQALFDDRANNGNQYKQYDFTYTADRTATGVPGARIRLTIVGRNNYASAAGSFYNDITVAPKNFGEITYDKELAYNGQANRVPTITKIDDGAGGFVPANAYTVSYFTENDMPVNPSNISQAGTYYFIATGTGLYEGSKSEKQKFKIVKEFNGTYEKDFSVVINNGNPTFPYTGDAITLDETTLKITDNGKQLKQGVDYRIGNCTNNTDVSEAGADVLIIGMGVYTGQLSGTFHISPISFTDRNLVITVDSVTYDRGPQTPGYTITYNGKDITELVKRNCEDPVYGNNTEAGAGTGTLTFTPKTGNFTGVGSGRFSIAQKSLLDTDITAVHTVNPDDHTRPLYTLTHTVGGTDYLLEEGKDYTITYNNNNGMPTTSATAVFRGIGNYMGTRTETYVIDPYPITNTNTVITLTNPDAYTYTGRPVLPAITVTYTEPGKAPITLTENTDFVIVENPEDGTGQNVNADQQAVVQIRGINKYDGTASTYFVIKKANLANPVSGTDITAALSDPALNSASEMIYTGLPLEPSAVVEYRVGQNWLTLAEGTDYTLHYSGDHTNVTKTVAVTITGTGNFEGELTREFAILPRELTEANLSVTATGSGVTGQEFKDFEFSYLGGEVLPELTYTFAFACQIDGRSVPLVDKTDITFKSVDNDRIGTAKMVVTAVENRNYTGSVEIPFYIKGNFDSTVDRYVKMTVEPIEKVYTGKPVELTKDDLKVTYQHANETPIVLEDTDYSFELVAGDPCTEVGDQPKITFTAAPGSNFLGSFTTAAGVLNITPKEFDAADENFVLKIPDQTYKGVEFTEDEIKAAITADPNNFTFNGVPVAASEYDLKFTGSGEGYYRDAAQGIEVTIEASSTTAKNYSGSMKASFNILPKQITAEDLANNILTAAIEEGGNLVLQNGKLVLVGGDRLPMETSNVHLTYTMGSKVLDNKQPTKADAFTCNIIFPEGGYRVVGPTTMTVEGTGNFTGTVDIPFTIYGDLAAGLDETYTDEEGNQAPVTDIQFDEINYFSESDITPEVTITYRGVELTKDTNFAVTYKGEIRNSTPVKTDDNGDPVKDDNGEFVYDETKAPTLTIAGLETGSFLSGTDITRTYIIKKCNLQKAYEEGTLTLPGLFIYGPDGTPSPNPAIEYNKDHFQEPLTAILNHGNTAATVSGSGEFNGFTVSYLRNEHGGSPDIFMEEIGGPPTAIITVTGNDNYEGTLEVYFTIFGVDLKKFNTTIAFITQDGEGNEVTVPDYTGTYTGSPFMPKIRLNINGQETPLIEKRDYLLEYRNNVDAAGANGANAPTVVIKGINDYSGSLEETFTIEPRRIDTVDENGNSTGRPDSRFVITVFNEQYTGATIIPRVEIIDTARVAEAFGVQSLYLDRSLLTRETSGTVLVQDTDYTLAAGAENLNYGLGAVNITGTGNYTGTVTGRSFNITKRSLADEYITVEDIPAETYIAAPVEPQPVVYIGDLILSSDNYSLNYRNNVNAGTAELVISSNSPNLEGSRTVSFEIGRKDLSTNNIVVADIPAQVYDPEGVKPDVEIHYVYDAAGVDVVLRNGTDYELSYDGTDRTGINIATVTINGLGNYEGTITRTFTIVDDIALADAVVIEPQEYTGQAIEPKPELTKDGGLLWEGSDYELSYENNTEAGTATIIVTGIGAYGGTLRIPFIIYRELGELMNVEGFAESYIYEGKEITPVPSKVTIGTGENAPVLTAGTDYTLSYENNINVGEASVTVTCINPAYSGSKTFTFRIIHRSVAQCTAEMATDVTYDGNDQNPTVTLRYGDILLRNGQDYTLVYLNNEKPGTARVIINGNGNFTGNKVLNFNINMSALGGVNATSSSSRKASLSWNANPVAAGYEIYDSSNNRVARLRGTSYNISGLTSGSSYTYRVRAYAIKGGQTFYSPFAEVTVNTN